MINFFKQFLNFLRVYPDTKVIIFYEVTYLNKNQDLITIFVMNKKDLKRYTHLNEYKAKRKFVWKAI